MKKLIIVDLSNFIFRAFFAIRPLHTAEGVPVNAVYGVLSMLYNLVTKYAPTHILIARDTKEGSFRKEIYSDYKANRTEPPDDLVPQFALVDELIKLLNLPQIKALNYEADDVIGSVATQWKKDFDEILIASGDKDLMQFVDGPIKMLDTMKEKIYSREDVKDKMGVYPEQIMDFLSLIGDTSDNIPGVPGIGPKGAQKLIEEYGNLEKILENVDQIQNKRNQMALANNKDKAILSKKLVQIITDLDLKLSSEESSYRLRLSPELEQFLGDLNFKSWQSKLAPFKLEGANDHHSKPHEDTKTSPIERWSLADLRKHIEEEEIISLFPVCDNEGDQRQLWRAATVATKNSVGYISLTPEDVRIFLTTIKDSDPLVVCYQSKPFLQLAMMVQIEHDFKYFDLAQAHFILNPEFRHDLFTLAEEYLGLRIVNSSKGQKDLFEDNDDDIKILGEKARAILLLYPLLEKKMKEIDVERPYYELDIPLIKVLAAMEIQGVCFDSSIYQELESEFSKQVEEIENEIYKIAGDKINLRSPKQVGELLFEKLDFPVIRKTKTGYSTDAEVLTELTAMGLSPIPELLIRYREIEKLLSTYVRALPNMVNPQTRKIHTHFQPSNAATGRLSSDNPNLQNIPVRTENGRKLRKGFIPSEGNLLLSADYSQVELRLLAHFSQDKNMLDAFKHDRDIHCQTAAEIFEIPLDEVTKDQRSAAKGINFGLMYGQSSFGLSKALHISQAEAKKYITSYFKKFHSVKTYLDGLKESAEEKGYAETLFGRKRNLPDIKSTNRQIKAVAERMAINSPIQGTAADIIKLAMINIYRIIKQRGLNSKMILQVHDELIFDVVPSELEEMQKLVREQMEGAVSLTVTLKVDMGVAKNWFDLK